MGVLFFRSPPLLLTAWYNKDAKDLFIFCFQCNFCQIQFWRHFVSIGNWSNEICWMEEPWFFACYFPACNCTLSVGDCWSVSYEYNTTWNIWKGRGSVEIKTVVVVVVVVNQCGGRTYMSTWPKFANISSANRSKNHSVAKIIHHFC